MPLAGWRMLLMRVDHGSIFDSEFPSLFRTTLSSAATLQADFFLFQNSLFAASPFLSAVHSYVTRPVCTDTS